MAWEWRIRSESKYDSSLGTGSSEPSSATRRSRRGSGKGAKRILRPLLLDGGTVASVAADVAISSDDQALEAEDEWEERDDGPPAPLCAWEDDGLEDE